MDYRAFIRERITSLRLKESLSEYQLSHDIGRAHSYINGITRGKALPSMTEFLSICERFGIEPKEFFDTETDHPVRIRNIIRNLYRLEENDLEMVEQFTSALESRKVRQDK